MSEETKNEVQQWSKEEIETIRKTVARDATDEELKMFLHLAQAYGLDPFSHDIWFIKDRGGKPIIMASRDGYLKIANSHPQYDNIEADVVYQGDHFRKVREGIEHIYETKNRGNPIGAYALVYRKDRHRPVYVYAPFDNYFRNTPSWRQYPHAMILKVAEAMALKRAFSISGLVTREEMDEAETTGQIETVQQQGEPANSLANSLDLNKRKRNIYLEYLKLCGNSCMAAQKEILKITDGRGSKDWTDEDLKMLEENLDFKRDNQETQVQDA